jgi:UTP--glucose-1-phosphate uridylyltransferase
MSRIRTAIIPAAGLGTRMLPATEAVPKELLPVGGHPAIDWPLHEVMAAGIDEVVVVTSNRKPALEHYVTEIFAKRADLPCALGKLQFHFVAQAAPRGLGDAVRCAWQSVGDESVAVLLPDELMLGGASLLVSLLEHHEREDRSMVALMQVAPAEIGSYGCARLNGAGPHGTTLISGFVEKPDVVAAPSNYAVSGRYVLGLEVLRALENTPPDRNGEIQLTEALDAATRDATILGLKLLPGDGRIDVGNWTGWLRANAQTFEAGDHPSSVAYRLLHKPQHLVATIH